MTRSFSSSARKEGCRIANDYNARKRFEEAWCRQGHSIFDCAAQRPAKYANKEHGRYVESKNDH